MRRITASLAAISIAAFLLSPTTDASAAPSSTGASQGQGQGLIGSLLTLLGLSQFGNLDTGQPNASCEDTPNQPGNSINAPGSAFNPNGVAGMHYAGQQPQNSKNPKSVAQYDVACTRPTH